MNVGSPFLLSPAGKDYLWGGSRLKDDYAKELDMSPLAETWECSTHPDGPSIVASGPNQGKLLSDVIKDHPEYLGTRPLAMMTEEEIAKGDIPILIKFIDAKKDLSVQVHPSDEYAKKEEGGQRGKTEMWYVLDAKKDSSLIYGFHHDISKKKLEKSLKAGTVERYLQKVNVKKDDVFLIKAGTVHAIGAGIMVAEIQESSNLTYRMYDYNRLGKDGKPRELHIEKSLAVANLKHSQIPRQPIRTLQFRPGVASELLCRCKYFQTKRLMINTEVYKKMISVSADPSSFQVLLCYDGCGLLIPENGDVLPFFKGDCIFVPAANSGEFKLHGKAKLLRVNC